MSFKAMQVSSVYRQLLKAVEKHIGKSGNKGHFTDFIIQEFRANAKLTNPFEVQKKMKLAHDYTFLLNSVHHHKGLFVAGTDTVAVSIEWAMTELIKHPEAMRRAQQEVRKLLKGGTKIESSHINEMQYLKQVIKETLRLHPPAPLLLPRICRETTKLSEYVIPDGTHVIINAWAIGRDPEFWKDPESFQPERFERCEIDFKGNNFEFIPFGAGRRMCPGMLFGLAGVEFWLAQLLLHFDWELPDGRKPEELDVSEVSGVILTRENDLCLLAFPHNSAILE